LRDHINLGLTFPLHTWPNPPLQTWIAGTVALTGARDSWLFVTVAQILNFIGLAYLVRTVRTFIGDDKVLPLVILFCGGLYYSAAVPSMALNADQIQVPIAAGLFYHFMKAARDNRWRDWLACGAFAGLAVLAKYSSVVLMAAMLGAAMFEPSLRTIFLNSRLYVAGIFALSITTAHFLPELSRPDAALYAASQFDILRSLEMRADALWHVVRSLFLYGAPVVIGLVTLAWRGNLSPARPRDPFERFIIATAVGIILLIVLMIVFGGLNYSTRHAHPYFGIWLLALVTLLTFPGEGVRDLANVMRLWWIALLLGSLIYSQVAIHRGFREPSPAAAEALRLNWDRQFACGPAYIIGDSLTARGTAINFGRPVIGIAPNDIDRAAWFDRERLRRYGAIVATTPASGIFSMLEPLVLDSPGETLLLPYRRTWNTSKHSYIYHFLAPNGC
jgi:hypothetical protein